jgi:hypothetical protein
VPLLNVRLDADDARIAAELREGGVTLSALVRDALHAEYERRIARPKRTGKRSVVVAAILASLPDPEDLPPRRDDAASREALRRHVRARSCASGRSQLPRASARDPRRHEADRGARGHPGRHERALADLSR